MDKKPNKTDERTAEKAPKRVIRLDDLDSVDDVVGGAGDKLFFGESATSRNPFEKGKGKGTGFQDGDDLF